MTTEFLNVGDLLVLEVYTGKEYEYYTRDLGDSTDVFRFQFGVTDKFTKSELRRAFAHWDFARDE